MNPTMSAEPEQTGYEHDSIEKPAVHVRILKTARQNSQKKPRISAMMIRLFGSLEDVPTNKQKSSMTGSDGGPASKEQTRILNRMWEQAV